MKKKIIIIAILSCLVLLLGTFTVANHFNNVEKAEAAYSMNVDDFIDKVGNSLLEEGYSPVISVLTGNIKNKEIVVTVEIPANEFKGNQTSDNIKIIISDLAKEAQLDSFLDQIEIKTIS